MQAIAYHHSCEDVGKTIKRTKRKYIWQFGFEFSEYDVERHEVILYASMLSGKRQIYVDGQKISSSKGQFTKLKIKFMIDQRQNSGLIQADASGNYYTLLINNIDFKEPYVSHLAQRNTVDFHHKNYLDLELGNQDFDEDQINHLNLYQERYRNNNKLIGEIPFLISNQICCDPDQNLQVCQEDPDLNQTLNQTEIMSEHNQEKNIEDQLDQ